MSHSHREQRRKGRGRGLKKMVKKAAFKAIMFGVLSSLIVPFHRIRNIIVEFILKWYLPNRRQCPAIKDKSDLLIKSAIDLAEMIRTKKLTSYELVNAYIERIKEINPIVNAIIDGPFMDALDIAKAIDERIAKGETTEVEFAAKPFLGVPFTTKDSTAIQGRLHTMGILARKNVRAKEDAECIRLMKEAGGIIIANTNIPEVCGWQETRNLIIGQTNNPYDTRRTVGGSSGGEGAIVTACGSAFGIGTDIGGSIRMPSFYCGIFGHKPTVGIINTKGCSFRTGRESSTMVVVGPMCRYTKDMVAMFKILAGPEKCLSLKLNEKVDVKKLKYYFIRESGEMRCNSVSNDLQDAMTKVIEHLHEISDHEPEPVKLSGIDNSYKLWNYWMDQEPADFNLLLGNGTQLNPFSELFKKLTGQSHYTMASIYNLLSPYLPKPNEDKIREMTRKLDEELTELLGDDGILLYHSTTFPAPFHYAPLVNIFNFSYWALFNVLHVPVTQVPLGLNADGIPVGIQVVASRNRDRDCFAVAEELEKAFGGWVPPFKT